MNIMYRFLEFKKEFKGSIFFYMVHSTVEKNKRQLKTKRLGNISRKEKGL